MIHAGIYVVENGIASGCHVDSEDGAQAEAAEMR